MKGFICNCCKMLIDEDDIEAIEVLQPKQRALFPYDKEEFVPSCHNMHDENQNLHYCENCKPKFYDMI